jgi:hypothetical protein
MAPIRRPDTRIRKIKEEEEEEEEEGVAGEEDIIVLDLLSRYGGLELEINRYGEDPHQTLNQELAWGRFSTK